MNDFTKEELEFILDGTRHWCNKNIPTPWVFEFKKKVKYMIDNYCDHEWRRSAINAIYCPYCQKHVEYSE